MRFSISQTEFLNALSVIQKGISTRSTLAILSGVLLEAEQDQLVLKSTNGGDLSVKYTAQALVEEPGKTVVSARLLLDIVKNLNDAAVHFATSGELATIKCDTSKFTVKTIDPDDFPEFPELTPDHMVSLSYQDFCAMIKRVSRAVSKEQDRVILTGINIVVEDNLLRMVATDSYRLALDEQPLSSAVEPFSAVISGSFLQEVTSLPKSASTITLGITGNQIVLSYGNTILINKKINGNYPNYKQILPSTYSARISIPVSQLSAAVRRMTLVGGKNAQMKLALYPQNQFIMVSAQTADIGSVEDSLPCSGEGNDLQIAFNCSYFLDGLSAIDSETCFLDVQAANRPGVLRAADGKRFLYLIMPVKIHA